MPPLFRTLLFAALFTSASGARADADEASLHGELVYGKATVGDAIIDDDALTIPMVGVGLRLTYATSDWFAYEARIGYGQHLRVAEYPTGGDTGTDVRQRNWYWYRTSFGLRARLGPKWIPTLSANLGAQIRGAAVGIIQDGWASLNEDNIVVEIIATAGAGFDYRFNSRWSMGVTASSEFGIAIDGSSFEATALMVHVDGYWYVGQPSYNDSSRQVHRR